MNNSKFVFRGLLLLVVVPFFFISSCIDKGNHPDRDTQHVPGRIVSLAPSITETLFSLGLGDRVVGVTSFCVFPSQVKEISQVGSFMSPNFEAIVSLKPDLVILVEEDLKVRSFLQKKGIAHVFVDNQDLPRISASINLIGRACGREDRAKQLVLEIQKDVDSIALESKKDAAHKKPEMMICVGRGGIGAGEISTIWLAGADTYYHELITAAGAKNVVTDSSMAYLTFSSEGVIRLKPDIIIDVMANMSEFKKEELKKDWQKLTTVPAVKNDMIFCLTGDYVTIPGPRIVLLLRDIQRIVREYLDKEMS